MRRMAVLSLVIWPILGVTCRLTALHFLRQSVELLTFGRTSVFMHCIEVHRELEGSALSLFQWEWVDKPSCYRPNGQTRQP